MPLQARCAAIAALAAALLLPALTALSALPARAEDTSACQPSPLGRRALYLRGSFNNWAATDEARFHYACDHYELHLRLAGQHSFKIGDENWSPDADLGGSAQALVARGGSLEQRFEPGIYRLVLRMSADGQPSLSIAPHQGPIPPRAEAPLITDKVALSVRFDSRAAEDKQPFGAVPAGSEIAYRLSALPGVERATLVIARRTLEGNQERLDYQELARLPMQRSAAGGHELWSVRHRFAEAAIYGYHFELRIGGRDYAYQNNGDSIYWTREKGSMGLGEIAVLEDLDPARLRRYRQTVFRPEFRVPAWARDAVYYYIFPERFRNGDRRNDPRPGGGRAQDRYQDQEVELHPKWLERPYKPGSGDGSDAVYNNDFFGGDLAGIIDKLDYIRDLGANAIYMTPVFRAPSNHKYDTADYTQIDPAFGTNADFERLCREAAKRGIRVVPDTSLNHVGSDSPYFNRWGNHPAGGAFDGGRLNPASRYASWFKLDPSQPRPEDQYQGWVGVKDLPEIDKSSADFRAFAYGRPDSVMKQWLDRGAAGWRMDVAPWVPDDFWREWRGAIKAHRPDAITIAETWFDASKFFLGDMFDSTMNYIFRNTVLDYAAGGDARKLYANIELMREAYPPQAFEALMNLLSSHDQARALHHLGFDAEQAADDAGALARAKQRLRLAVLFQMVFPGAPAIYYGDEVGLAGGDDPYNRAPYPWADQGGRPDEALLADFKRLTALRHALPVLRHGSLEAPLHLDEHLIVLARRDGRSWALTATNNAETARKLTLSLPAGLRATRLRDALGGRVLPVHEGRIELKVPPLSGLVLIPE